jgi:enterochelin esterase-like enzyme
MLRRIVLATFVIASFTAASARAQGRGPQGPVVVSPVVHADRLVTRDHQADLDNAAAKRGLRLLWFATGKDDFVMNATRASVALLKKHGFSPVFVESDGGHTWINWRDYLSAFAPQLFHSS